MIKLWGSLQNSTQPLQDLAEVGQGLAYLGSEKLPKGVNTISDTKFPGSVRGFSRFEHTLKYHDLPTEVWMNLDEAVIGCKRTGATVGRPQILVNYGQASRGPWRLKALLDEAGHAVTSRFLTIRPLNVTTPVLYLWSLINSPLSNGYVYAFSMKRDVLAGTMRNLPIPNATNNQLEYITQMPQTTS